VTFDSGGASSLKREKKGWAEACEGRGPKFEGCGGKDNLQGKNRPGRMGGTILTKGVGQEGSPQVQRDSRCDEGRKDAERLSGSEKNAFRLLEGGVNRSAIKGERL